MFDNFINFNNFSPLVIIFVIIMVIALLSVLLSEKINTILKKKYVDGEFEMPIKIFGTIILFICSITITIIIRG